ncbi:biotin-dependent carboxyltransferase family protein [Pseudotenacibaculum sp. MALMAid0570]|uniref:5-oxoprolinase subunit C family protein n=1 Tax=Pseudotenacibaculum sp. MALMAid0570 TaxID=3143938 RepID=UPI0032DF2B69
MIKVLHPGIYCSVQDQGRLGLAKKGIPRAGSMDSFSADLANVLLQNDKKSAVVEITFGQGKFEFTSGAYICLTGGHFSPKINAISVKMNAVYEMKKGDVLSFGKRLYGARTYLAVQGGIQTEPVLESRSFFAGITQQRLIKGDKLKILEQKFHELGHARIKSHDEHFTSSELECFPGPEYDLLDNNQKKRLKESFTISSDTNRVGYRLNELVENDLPSILTSAVLPGTVQLTPSGKLIVLMRDAQVTGGYPRVLQLSEYAVSRLSQKIAGEEINFRY